VLFVALGVGILLGALLGLALFRVALHISITCDTPFKVFAANIGSFLED